MPVVRKLVVSLFSLALLIGCSGQDSANAANTSAKPFILTFGPDQTDPSKPIAKAFLSQRVDGSILPVGDPGPTNRRTIILTFKCDVGVGLTVSVYQSGAPGQLAPLSELTSATGRTLTLDTDGERPGPTHSTMVGVLTASVLESSTRRDILSFLEDLDQSGEIKIGDLPRMGTLDPEGMLPKVYRACSI